MSDDRSALDPKCLISNLSRFSFYAIVGLGLYAAFNKIIRLQKVIQSRSVQHHTGLAIAYANVNQMQ